MKNLIIAILLLASVFCQGQGTTDSTATPVTFTSFKILEETPVAETLGFSTASEQNNDHFVISYSLNSAPFKDLVPTIASKGDANGNSTSPLTYEYVVPRASIVGITTGEYFVAGFEVLVIALLITALIFFTIKPARKLVMPIFIFMLMGVAACHKNKDDAKYVKATVVFQLRQIDKDLKFAYYPHDIKTTW